MKPKTIHKAKHLTEDGRVSPLCAKKPRAINLSRAGWALLDEFVTCKKCQQIMAEADKE